MRTNIVIDDKLMAQAMKVGGFKTKREAVEAGLNKLVSADRYQKMIELRGKVEWVGNLEEMRLDKPRSVIADVPEAALKKQLKEMTSYGAAVKKARRA